MEGRPEGEGEGLSRRTAEERLSMVLAIVPWLHERGGATVDEVAEQFDLPAGEVLEVLSMVQCCEVPPYAGSTLGIAVFDDGEIVVDPLVAFDRPMRLTLDEAFGLRAVARLALATNGADPDGALARALSKLEAVLGSETALHVELDEPEHLPLLREAVGANRVVRITYYAAYRDDLSERDVEPHRLVNREGHWYLVGHCRLVGDQRTFRVDRIEEATLLDETVEPVVEPAAEDRLAPDDAAPRVRLRLAPSARWVCERYPVDEVREGEDGWLETTMPVTGRVFLEQLLLRLGPNAEVLEPAEMVNVGSDAAARLLETYR